jgi:hypothetical protein
MDPTREPPFSGAEPDDDVVAYLRARAPGLPTVRFDPRAVTVRARAALRRRRRRRLRNSLVAVVAAAAAYLALALAGPVPVPGLGTVSVPGSDAVRAMVARFVPGGPPGPDRWQADVDRLQREVVPVFERLDVSYYLLEPGQCRILKYSRGDFSDQNNCEELTPFDAQARADFDELTAAVERSGLAVERIRNEFGGIYVQIKDSSWQYNWAYAYLPSVETPPPTTWPEERWTHIRGHWWFHRTHDD